LTSPVTIRGPARAPPGQEARVSARPRLAPRLPIKRGGGTGPPLQRGPMRTPRIHLPHLAVLGVVLAAGILAATGGGGSSSPSAPATPPPPTPTPTPASTGTADLVITISGDRGNMSFSPADATVKVGQTVAWRNADTDFHTATQDGRRF